MFIYCLTNPGFEAQLKAEAAYRYPDFHPSFSRPGFVTFKVPEGQRVPRFTFARVTGHFLAKGGADLAQAAIQSGARDRIVHRFHLAEGRTEGTEAAEGAGVWDVVEVFPGEFWWGVRTVGPWDWGCPGGLPNLELPDSAPSRAWLKLEEMVLWSRWSPAKGLTALEFGSSPGGASWALLNRGFKVVGVDVAPMAEVCLQNPHFQFCPVSIRDLRKKDLPEKIDVLFCDLGLKPVEAVPQIRHFCQIIPSIRRVYYTLKMGKGQEQKDLEGWFEAFRLLGFEVHTTHLPSNRMELLVVAVR